MLEYCTELLMNLLPARLAAILQATYTGPYACLAAFAVMVIVRHLMVALAKLLLAPNSDRSTVMVLVRSVTYMGVAATLSNVAHRGCESACESRMWMLWFGVYNALHGVRSPAPPPRIRADAYRSSSPQLTGHAHAAHARTRSAVATRRLSATTTRSLSMRTKGGSVAAPARTVLRSAERTGRSELRTGTVRSELFAFLLYHVPKARMPQYYDGNPSRRTLSR